MNSREFGAYVKNKYGTLAAAKNTVHHYEQIVRTRTEATGTSEPIPEATLEVDITPYDALDAADVPLPRRDVFAAGDQ